MDLRPRGPLPAIVWLTLSALLLYIAVVVDDDGNQAASHLRDEALVDAGLVAWGGLAFLGSLVAAVVATVLMVVQAPPASPQVEEGAMAPSVGLVGAAKAFVLRLHATTLMAGGVLVAGGLGLVPAASLVADGTLIGPFQSIPGKLWVVRLNVWQVHVTLWAFVLLGVASSSAQSASTTASSCATRRC